MVKLGDAFSYIKNGASIKQGNVCGGYPITRIETISNSIVDRNKMGYAGIGDVSKYENYILENGDILMSHINSEKHLGKTAYYEKKTDEIVIHGMNLLCLKAISESLYYKFANYFFNSNCFKNQIPTIANKSVNQASFTVTALKKLQIPLPSLEIQRKIARNLDIASELIALRKKQLAELDNLIKSTFYDMFGDPVTNEKEWEAKTVNDVCEKILGGGTPSKQKPEYYIGSIPWVTPKDMKSILINDSIDHINEKAIANSSAKLIPARSILMVIRSGILKRVLPVAINSIDVAVNQDMKAFITNENVSTEYLLYFFIMIQKDILKNVRAVTADNIEFSLIKNTIIPLPPLALQEKFAEIVTKIEEQKYLVQKSVSESQYLFDSLMNEYFE